VNFRSPERRRAEPSLDLTPLIDVVFLLLIFFLVTATFAQRDTRVVPVDLPSGASGESDAATTRVTLYLEADGTYTLHAEDDEPVRGLDRSGLQTDLETLFETAPDTPLYLRGDEEVRYGDVMDLLDLARTIGFRRVFNVIRDAQ
jgi:biopolymer transport protein ExbD